MSRTWKDSKDRKLSKFYRDMWNYSTYKEQETWRLSQIFNGFSQQRQEIEFLNKNKKYFKGAYQFTHSSNSHAPSWFVNLFMTRKARRKDKLHEHLVKIHADTAEDLIWTLARKPWIYHD